MSEPGEAPGGGAPQPSAPGPERKPVKGMPGFFTSSRRPAETAASGQGREPGPAGGEREAPGSAPSGQGREPGRAGGEREGTAPPSRAGYGAYPNHPQHLHHPRPPLEGSAPPPPGGTSATRESVITLRATESDLAAVDSLVEAGIMRTRSEAAAWLLNAGIAANAALFARVQGILDHLRALREEAQRLGKEFGATPADPGLAPQRRERDLQRAIRSLRYTGSGERALQLFAQAQEEQLPAPDLWIKLGMALYDAGQYEEALAAFQQTEATSEDLVWRVVGLVWQGQMLDLLGRRDEALACYRKALAAGQLPTVVRHDQYGIIINKDWIQARIDTPFRRMEAVVNV